MHCFNIFLCLLFVVDMSEGNVKLGLDPPCQLTDSQAHLPPNAKVQGGRLQNESFVRKLRRRRRAWRSAGGVDCGATRERSPI